MSPVIALAFCLEASARPQRGEGGPAHSTAAFLSAWGKGKSSGRLRCRVPERKERRGEGQRDRELHVSDWGSF